MERSRSARRGVFDEAAFDRLVLAQRAPLERYARRLGASWEDAEEIAATALLRAYQNPPEAHLDPEWRAWLRSVARNLWIDVRRRRQLRVVTDQDTLESVSSMRGPIDQIAAAAEEARQICAAIALLPSGQRAAIYLREVRGLSYEEIAAELGMTLSAVTSTLHRARESVSQGRGGLRRALAVSFAPLALLRRGGHAARLVGGSSVVAKVSLPIALLVGAGGVTLAALPAITAPPPHSTHTTPTPSVPRAMFSLRPDHATNGPAFPSIARGDPVARTHVKKPGPRPVRPTAAPTASERARSTPRTTVPATTVPATTATTPIRSEAPSATADTTRSSNADATARGTGATSTHSPRSKKTDVAAARPSSGRPHVKVRPANATRTSPKRSATGQARSAAARDPGAAQSADRAARGETSGSAPRAPSPRAAHGAAAASGGKAGSGRSARGTPAATSPPTGSAPPAVATPAPIPTAAGANATAEAAVPQQPDRRGRSCSEFQRKRAVGR